MKVQIITIGDEILIGQTINTNTSFIGEILSENSIEVVKTSAVGDEKEIILKEFKDALNNFDVVITTGGLGPTHDDLTRECVVEYFKTELIENSKVLDNITKIFKRRGREVTAINKDQAMVPKDSEVIFNEHGTAPGFWIERNNKIMVVLPGVPLEMKAMMIDTVIPKLLEKIGKHDEIVLRKTLQTTGIPESFLFEKLGNLDDLLQGGKLAFLPSQFGVKLRISVTDKNEDDAKNKMSGIEQKIRSKVGRYVFGFGEERLEEVISRLLLERGLTIAVAESCTGGMISNMLTNIHGSSGYFHSGILAYSNAAKVEMLKVDEDTISVHGAVSYEVSLQMAAGIKSISGTDLGLAVTGIMGPTGGSTDKPVGTVFISICDANVCTARKFNFGENRILNKERTSQAALDMIRRHLLGIAYDE